MRDHDRRVIHSSEESNWRTPQDCYNKLDDEARFVVDLAADLDNALVSRDGESYTFLGPGSVISEDAFAVKWSSKFGRGPGFLNPPFSKKLANAYRTGRIEIDGTWVEHEKNETKARWYEVESWAEKCWQESRQGFTTYAILPYAPQTEWFRAYVQGHEIRGQQANGKLVVNDLGWAGHAAMEERRLPHRISFLRPDGSAAANAGVNSCVIVWKPNPGYVGPWQPAVRYWSYR